MIITIAVPIVLVIGLIVGASYLQHDVESNLGTSQGGTSGPITLSTTEVNLDTALSAGIKYAAGHQHSFAGVTGATGLAAAVPSLSFPSVSNSASEIAVYMPGPGALVMTSFQPNPAACVGVLEVLSDQAIAVFGNYPNTASTGTYYFEAPPGTDDLCGAISVEPSVGGNYLSVTGFPTEPLP
jgi:hypothetical protein